MTKREIYSSKKPKRENIPPKERYIPPNERRKIIDELRLI